jgi:hypothetical protein
MPPDIQYPSYSKQVGRIRPQFARLQKQFDDQVAEIRKSVPAADVEQVVVLETIGDVDGFYRAVEKAGLQFLLDADGDGVAPDENFRRKEHAEDELPTKLFLILTNQSALQELLRLWSIFARQGRPGFPHGFARWADVFQKLREVRLWGIQDRLGEDTRAHWQSAIENGLEFVRTEIDVWYSNSDQRNLDRTRELLAILASLNARVVHQSDLPEIRYRGVLADLPTAQVAAVLAGGITSLSVANQVMYFRPQLRGMTASDGPERNSVVTTRPVPTGNPVVGVLDGVPLANHALLGQRISIVDPYNYAAHSPPQDRAHGTSMASLVLHGDLSRPPATISSRVVCLPVLVPDPASGEVPRREISPPDRLLVDVIYLAVRHLLDVDGGQPPAAPTIRVIQFAIGDVNREFVRDMSPLARLIDWLSWKYRVMFVVPTGNLQDFSHGIELEAARQDFANLSEVQRQAEALRAIESNTARRLLSPAESINAITVGGVYDDGSLFTAHGRFAVFPTRWPAPEGRNGPGFLRAIKPDVVAPSGRRLFYEKLGTAHARATVVPVVGVASAPGILSCATGNQQGQVNLLKYSSGTSNSSALVSHAAAHAFSAVEALRSQSTAASDAIPERDIAVLLKAMVVHCAHWPNDQALEDALKLADEHGTKRLHRLERLFGNGLIDIDRIRGCPDERATFLAVGSIEKDQGMEFNIPLPMLLTGKQLWRRLSITLAWNSPINCQHRDYRRAQLWFKAENGQLCATTAGGQWQSSRRGTVQHQVWIGENAIAYAKNSSLPVLVSCAADAGSLTESIPFGLCVSIEAAEGSSIAVYPELAARVSARVSVRPGQRR